MTIQELKAINYHWRLAIDQVGEGILILQGPVATLSELRVVFCNQSAASKLGAGNGDPLKGVAFTALVSPPDRERLLDDWRQAMAAKQDLRGDYQLMDLSGAVVNARWTISTRSAYEKGVPDHTVTLSWASREPIAPPSGTDVGEISGDHAFEISKADTISHITKGIVHDFNNSLMAIRGQLEVALPEVTEDSQVHQALTQAMEAAVTTSELCQRLLSYAKGRRADKKPCLVPELVHQAVSISSLGSNVTCRRLIQPDLWPILADGIQIVQVINNLLMNAQQAMPNGGVIALVAENVPIGENSTLGLPPGNYVGVTVRDRGVGIPEGNREHIFEALFTTKENGSGLGLATCAEIISSHDGYIDVHSVPDRGSEFIVYLPAAPGANVSVTPEPSPAEPPLAPTEGNFSKDRQRASSGQRKILVVEDQVGISKIAQVYLQKLGHSVICAATGQEGIRAYREAWHAGDPFDLAIIDMTLPGGMNGEDTFRELRNIDPHVVGIATSGALDKESLPVFQSKGFATILPKPFPLKMLSEVVEEAMLFHMV